MLNGLFLNTEKAQCSIHEVGLMVYNAIVISDKYNLDYTEISSNNSTFKDNYDFLLFNYHPWIMEWLDITRIKNLPGIKMACVFETLPGDPFPLCAPDIFDLYLPFEPGMKCDNKKVYPMPRPLEHPYTGTYKKNETLTIGSFGFPTAGKGFENIIEAVSKEFDRAIIRFNIPKGTYITVTDKKTILPMKPMYAEKLEERCMNLARDGIELRITNNYLNKKQLINWCAENDLNVFLYNRNQSGLSATTDQAISSGRPLAVSDNPTFRHLHEYIKPYPQRSLKESLVQSGPEVLQMRIDWQPSNLRKAFEAMLDNEKIPIRRKSNNLISIAKRSIIETLYHRNLKRVNFYMHPVDEHIPRIDFGRPNVLMISQKERMCGIYQYGRNITNTLRKSKKYNFMFCECGNATDLYEAVKFYSPIAIIYNYYHPTMPWIKQSVTRKYKVPQLAIIHEFVQKDADKTTNRLFDYSLYQDPDLIVRNPYVFRTKQLLYPYTNTTPLPEIPTIGSFGFGFPDKGFEKLVATVQDEFDIANIRLHIPFNDVVDPYGINASKVVERCFKIVKKPGISLAVTHDFWTEPQLLDFLAGNTINCFFTDVNKVLGISGATHHALAVHRPIAITKCQMYRDILNTTPSICIEDLTLKEIITNGTKPLERFYREWSEEEFIKDYEGILETVLK